MFLVIHFHLEPWAKLDELRRNQRCLQIHTRCLVVSAAEEPKDSATQRRHKLLGPTQQRVKTVRCEEQLSIAKQTSWSRDSFWITKACMAVHDFCADEKRGNIQTETLFWWLGCESSMMGIWYAMQWHHDVRWMTRQGQDTIKRILSWTQLQRDSDWTWLKHREPLCLTFLLIMMIHIILKLRNIEDLWDCDSDAPEILPPSCHMPSPWPGLSGTSVLLRQPTWIYSSSTPEPFNNLCQKRSQTFTEFHRCSEVKTCSDWNEASLFHFISGCCFLFASEFAFFMLVRSQSAGLQKNAKCGCRCPPWYVSLRVRTPPMSARTSVTAGKYCFS